MNKTKEAFRKRMENYIKKIVPPAESCITDLKERESESNEE